MEKSSQKSSLTKKGFSLIEVVVALFILSTSIIVLYKLILSTNVSIFNLQDHYLSKEVANNRIALIHSIEKPSINSNRNGFIDMGGKTWEWQENFEEGDTKDFLQYEILIKLKDSNKYIYRTQGYIANE
ncbi:type II secretion system minor pseudopilin GspI [Gammaproteobacteria bacterium]|jgi:type II secretion system protein I|nr:type II secretion system minor pseudopilin GspI [Gammaproteobacteria bacterium]